MNDISVFERREAIGKRIKQERDRAKLTQGSLAEKLGEITGIVPQQSTISMWERGLSFPDNIETIFALSKIFKCDCGYLLCDYDERTSGASGICQATGLSESTVNSLCSMATWGAGKEAATVIDALMYESWTANEEHIAPLVFLINWFLRYDGGKLDEGNRVHTSGKIIKTQDKTGYLPNSLNLDSRLIENAALVEIQQGLISLKKRLSGDEK